MDKDLGMKTVTAVLPEETTFLGIQAFVKNIVDQICE